MISRTHCAKHLFCVDSFGRVEELLLLGPAGGGVQGAGTDDAVDKVDALPEQHVVANVHEHTCVGDENRCEVRQLETTGGKSTIEAQRKKGTKMGPNGDQKGMKFAKA